MAVMTPATPPPNEQGKQAERDAYLDFQSQLPDEFHVYYSLELVTADAREAEIDFLILHPELGVLVVECKGGGVERNSAGIWVRRHDGDEEVLDESPWEQAARHQRLLKKQLEKRMNRPKAGFKSLMREYDNNFPLPYGRAVAFPFAEADEANLPLDAGNQILFDASDFDDIEQPVRSAMTYWKSGRKRATFDRDQFDRFREEVLYPTTSLAESLAARIRSEDRAFERLTDEQKQTIRALGDENRLLVQGGAGTGKSLLALEAARMLAEQGQRVLLTCFNRKLRNSLAAKVASGPDAGGNIEVNHFAALCRAAIEATAADVEYPNDEDKETTRQFWEEKAPLILWQALEDGTLPGWDALVVDEAQDFEDDWWDILQIGLEGGTDGRLVAFHDPTQDLFDRADELPEVDFRHRLTWNFRNTTRICETVEKLYDGPMQSHPRTPAGEPPTVQAYESRDEQRNAIDALVRRLVDDRGLTPEHLVILTPRTRPHSVLAGCDTIGGLPLTDTLAEADDHLLHTTIGAFKGLERDVVIFADVDPDHERCSRNARYVAASRAVNRLYVFQKSDWLGDV